MTGLGMLDNSSQMDTNEHQLSDIIEIITPELDGLKSSHKPYLRIVEQPTRYPMRFRYKCEGRTAGTIPGENTCQDTKTYPTVEIVGYDREALILVSCVTTDAPYRQHPHQLVGRNCKSGVCTRNVGPGQPLRAEFSNVGIQCVRKKEVAESLEERMKKKVDPFNTGFDHMNDPNSIELNSLRLCFQGFLKGAHGWEALSPVVSEPLYDRKANSQLVINRLCNCSATINGGDEIILLCSKVNKDDVKIRFKAIDNVREIWHAYADFQPCNVHKRTAIVFRTPRYPQADLPKTAKTYVELECPSLNKRSEPLEFEFHDPECFKRERKRRKTSGQSLINQINADLGLNLDYHSISMGNDFNLPEYLPLSSAPESDIKYEPALATLTSVQPTTVGGPQHYDTYRNTHQLSPQSQMSPLSPQNRNATPSPISAPVNGNAYAEQLCTMMEGSTLRVANCQIHNLGFNNQENHGYFGYHTNLSNSTGFNKTNYNNNNYEATNANSVNYFGQIRNTTSGGCFERINNTPTSPTAAQQVPSAQPFIHNLVSETERIEIIKRDLMQMPFTPTQSPPPANYGCHENTFH